MRSDPIGSTAASRPDSSRKQTTAALYRFGFLLLAADRAPLRDYDEMDATADWDLHRIGGFHLWTHPETRFALVARGETHLLLVGEAYTTAGANVEDLLRTVTTEPRSDSDLVHLAEHLGGRFAVIVIQGDGFRAINDAFGARSLFYSTDEPQALGSHARLLARAIGVGESSTVRTVLNDADYRKRKVKYLPGDFTVFSGIYALIPNNLYDSSQGATRRYWPTLGWRRSTFEDFLTKCQIYFDHFVPFVTGRYRPLFGITGGIDSRTLLAAFRTHAARVAGVTWSGGYLAAQEKPEVARLVRFLGIEHRRFDPAKCEIGEIAMLSHLNSGGYRQPARLTEAMARAYSTESSFAFIRGYGGEIIRGFYNAFRQRLDDYSAEAMQTAYEKGGKLPSESRRVRGMFEEFRERGNYASVDRSGFDPSDIFYWEHRMGMWGSCMLNEMDAAMPSFVGYNDRAVYAAAFGLADDERLTKRLLGRLMEHIDPEFARLGATPESSQPRREATNPPSANSGGAPAADVPAPSTEAATSRMTSGPVRIERRNASDASVRHRSDLIYYQYFRYMVHCLGANAASIVDVGSGNMPYLEWFDWIPERVSIDLDAPYRSKSVHGIQGDVLDVEVGKRFDLCTSLQTLALIDDPLPFAERLLELGRTVLVSVPYKWPASANRRHRQNPIDLKKLTAWFARAPNYHLVVREPFSGQTGARLFAVFDVEDPQRRFGEAIRKNRRPIGFFDDFSR